MKENPRVRACRLLRLALLACIFTPDKFALSQDMIPRALLIDMARSQYSVMCQSSTFASCMGFSSKQCADLAETAIERCLLPLPSEISPDELKNTALESCPQGVFADAGYSEEKAGVCFDKAMEAG